MTQDGIPSMQISTETKKKEVVYIAGKVTGLDPQVFTAKFAKKQEALEALGYEVYNPVALVANAEKHFEDQTTQLFRTWEDYMRFLLPYLANCDELHLLPCWNDSKGAILERDIALRLGIPVVYHTNL